MDEEANYILRQAGYDIKPWEGFVQRGSTYGGISKSISHDKLKGNSFWHMLLNFTFGCERFYNLSYNVYWKLSTEPLSSASEHDLNMLYKRYELDYRAFGYTVDHATLEIGGWDE